MLSTTRNPAQGRIAVRGIGVDHVMLDDGDVATAFADRPDGVDGALELVGTPTLPDTLRAVTRSMALVCFTGMLSNVGPCPTSTPSTYLPKGVRLSAYSGDASDLPADVLQRFLDDVAAGHVVVPLYRSFVLDEIREAHAIMESGDAVGKLVVTIR